MNNPPGKAEWQQKSLSPVGSRVGRLVVISGILGLAVSNDLSLGLDSWLAITSFALQFLGLVIFLSWWFANKKLEKRKYLRHT